MIRMLMRIPEKDHLLYFKARPKQNYDTCRIVGIMKSSKLKRLNLQCKMGDAKAKMRFGSIIVFFSRGQL
jgi:hypothetical protein